MPLSPKEDDYCLHFVHQKILSKLFNFYPDSEVYFYFYNNKNSIKLTIMSRGCLRHVVGQELSELHEKHRPFLIGTELVVEENSACESGRRQIVSVD